MSKNLCCTQPPSNTNFLATFRCFSVQFSFVFLSSKATAGSSQILPSILHTCCPLPPADCSGLLQKHFLHIFWANVSHVHSCLPFKYQSVPIRPLDTQITCLAHHCSCRSSYLSPHLTFLTLFHPGFSLFMMPFSGPDSLCPVLSGQGGKFLIHFQAA